MTNLIKTKLLQTALFSVIGVTAACGGVAIGSVLAKEPLRGDGGMAVLAGRRRHSGTLSGIYDPDDPVEDYFEEGDTVGTLQLYVAAAKYYEGAAVIESLTIPDVDITEGSPIRWDASFRANGLFSRVGFS